MTKKVVFHLRTGSEIKPSFFMTETTYTPWDRGNYHLVEAKRCFWPKGMKVYLYPMHFYESCSNGETSTLLFVLVREGENDQESN